MPFAGFDGADYVVVWGDTRNGAADIYGARVEQDGTVLEPDGFTISTADYRQGNPAFAAGGPGKALIVYDGYTDEYPYRATRCWGVLHSHSRGDLNCDGSFNGADIDPFFLALGDPAAYVIQFPNCDIMLGDMNGDGAVNGADIDSFFECLGGGCP